MATSAAPSYQEITNRALRVSKLVDAIDRTFGKVLDVPREVMARCVLLCIDSWEEPCWRYLCAEAGIEKLPSAKTIDLITGVYRARAQKDPSQ
jgi:hypothetical protein